MSTKKVSPKDQAADKRLRREYQITLEEHKKVFKFQNYVCAMCKQPVSEGKSRLAVDHRHSDGLLRGLLCMKCNRAIGAFHRFFPDTVDMFQAAVEYLRNPPMTAVFKKERFTVPGKVGTKKRAKLLKELRNQIQIGAKCVDKT